MTRAGHVTGAGFVVTPDRPPSFYRGELSVDIKDQIIRDCHRLGACVPSDAVCTFMDGNKRCVVYLDFINLMESPAGFGDTFDEALKNLKASA
jgi:hypothetical protein